MWICVVMMVSARGAAVGKARVQLVMLFDPDGDQFNFPSSWPTC